MDGHWGALDYDLMTRTRFTARDVGGALPWASLMNFVAHLDRGSALWRELHPESAEVLPWLDGERTAAILADLYDLVSAFMYQHASANSERRPKKPRQYPRPGVEDRSRRRIGRGAVSAADFEKWWQEKAAQAA